MNNFPLSGGDDKNLSESLATRGARLKMSRFNFLTSRCTFQQSGHINSKIVSNHGWIYQFKKKFNT